MSNTMIHAISATVNKQVGELARSTSNSLAELTLSRVNQNTNLHEESTERLRDQIATFDSIATALEALAADVRIKADRFQRAVSAIDGEV